MVLRTQYQSKKSLNHRINSPQQHKKKKIEWGMENMHADITVYRLGVTLRLHVNETKVMRLDETKQ